MKKIGIFALLLLSTVTAIAQKVASNGPVPPTGSAVGYDQTNKRWLYASSDALGNLFANAGANILAPSIASNGPVPPAGTIAGWDAVNNRFVWANVDANGNLYMNCTAGCGTGSGVSSINGSQGAFSFSGAGVSCVTTNCTFSGGGSSTTFQVNGTGLSSQTTVNFQNSAATNGLTLTFTNPSAGIVQLGFTGQLANAGLATQTANTVLGALTATTPSGLAMPSCSTGTSALTWTTGTGFGCNSITGGGGTTTNALTINNGGAGAASGSTFNGSAAITLSYNSIGAAPLASPTFTGTPAAPTATVSTNTTQIATTAFVVGQVGTATPLIDGTAAVGTSLLYARQDHVHPTDTTRAPVASPTFTGTATTPALTISGITGATQCLTVNTSGVVSGTGTACGSGGSGISGLTANFIPLAGTATTITANSHLDDGVTTASTITSSEPIVVASSGSSNVTIGASGTLGTLSLGNATSGLETIQVATGALATNTVTIPNATDTLVMLTQTQTLTNKTLDGVTPTTMAFVDATSSIQTQLNAKSPIASPTFTGTATTPALTVSGITGSTQCLQASTSGVVSGTGSACGGGAGLPTSSNAQTYYSSSTTGAATSAILVDSASTTGALVFQGVESHFPTGPTASTTTNGSLTNVNTTITVVSTTGYPSCSTQTPCYLVIGANAFIGEVVSCTAIGSGTTFTGCTRSLPFGNTAANPASSGASVDLISDLEVDSLSATTARKISIWKGPTGYQPDNNFWFLSGSALTGSGYLLYAGLNGMESTAFRTAGNAGVIAGASDNLGIKFSQAAGTLLEVIDGNGVVADSAATLAVTSGTTTIAPVTGVVGLTGTAPTALATMTPSSACTNTGVACQVKLFGVGFVTTTAGNFFAIYTVTANTPKICTYLQIAAPTANKWYCQ